MSDWENDYDWLQNFFPGWKEEDQLQVNRNNAGPEQNQQQSPHPAFADAAYVRLQQSRSLQARGVQMNRQAQSSAQYSQGMDQTLFRSQLHQHSPYEQQQQPQMHQQPQQQPPRLPQPQPYRQAQYQAQYQAQHRAEQQARQQEEEKARQRAEQYARRQAEKEARQQAEQQAQQLAQNYAQFQARKKTQQLLRPPPQTHRGQLQQYYQEAQAQHQEHAQSSSRHQQDQTQPVPPVTNTVPQALRTYATLRMIGEYPPQANNTSAQTDRSISKPATPTGRQTNLAAVPQAPAQIPHSTSAPSVRPLISKATVPAIAQKHNATAPSQSSAPTARGIPVSSALPVIQPVVPAGPQPAKATAPIPASAQSGRSISTPSAPPVNIAPFVPASTLAGPSRKLGRPAKYPTAVDSVNQPAGFGRFNDRWQVHSTSNAPPDVGPAQDQPRHGLPVLQNIAPATASGLAPAPPRAHPPAWNAHPNIVYPAPGPPSSLANRLEPASSQLSKGLNASSQSQPARVYNPPPNSAKIAARLAGQGAHGPTQPPAAKLRKLDDSSQQAVTPPSKTTYLPRYIRQPPSRKNITYRSDIVDPVKISDILIKLDYDPATIARDVLIVADKHPIEKVLNHHLQSLRQNFQAVDHSSDLATFRWDLVDPYVQYPPWVLDAASRVQETPTSSTLRLETTMRAPNLPPNFPDSARQGVSHVPARDAPTAPLARPAERRPGDNTSNGNGTTRPGTDTPSAGITSSGLDGPGLISSGSFNSGRNDAYVASTSATNTNLRASNFAYSPAISSTTSSASSTPKATHKPISTPPSAVSLNAFPKSPRGKLSRQSPLPKGLREPQVVIPASPHAMAPIKKRPGRPPHKDVQVEVEIDNRPATQYQVFKCKWTGCEAELHNLQAIHTHILGIHIPHHIVCVWDNCTDKHPRAAAQMWEHVRDDHMRPLAWELGDGPAASVTGEDVDLLPSTALT
ncbi:uncharacterized protein N7458_004468 [Penicillium daleae]|uniref:C2H2-type domain-containing protein n=1 Tax=Penicillium daleae TaxID=63821 RepID=A0AAD6C658_9EURO|nr:uncharacterized protein N7458_004468 [Penicillium daleae]KAJ5453512.1 hypothetical protein N7458_004468 [Penicillium daleae]